MGGARAYPHFWQLETPWQFVILCHKLEWSLVIISEKDVFLHCKADLQSGAQTFTPQI